MKINASQMRIVGKENMATQKGGFSENDRIVDFIIKNQSFMSQFVGDLLHNSMANGHKIHKVKLPIGHHFLKCPRGDGSQPQVGIVVRKVS